MNCASAQKLRAACLHRSNQRRALLQLNKVALAIFEPERLYAFIVLQRPCEARRAVLTASEEHQRRAFFHLPTARAPGPSLGVSHARVTASIQCTRYQYIPAMVLYRYQVELQLASTPSCCGNCVTLLYWYKRRFISHESFMPPYSPGALHAP